MKFFCVPLFVCCVALCALATGNDNLLPNGSFQHRLQNWWGTDHTTISGMPPVATLKAVNANANLNSDRLTFGKAIFADRTYRIQCKLRSLELSAGTFAASITLFRADSTYAGQFYFARRAPGVLDTQWQNAELRFGRGTRYEFPPDAVSACVRFAFWDASGKCSGAIEIAEVEWVELNSGTANAIEPAETAPVAAGRFLRHEALNGKNYYFLEAESLAAPGAVRGRLENQKQWTLARSAMPNESGDASLVRPEWRNPAPVKAEIPIDQPGKYHLWARIGTFKTWGKSGITFTLNGARFPIETNADDMHIGDAYSWIRITDRPLELTDSLSMQFINDRHANNFTSIDLFMLTDDTDYVPERQLPPRHFFSILPDRGVPAQGRFWHPAMLQTPVYLCAGSSQQFLLQLRNFTAKPLQNFALELTLPESVTLEDPTRSKRWSGDENKWKNPHFIDHSPDRVEHQIIERNGLKFNRYSLFFDRPIPPYRPQEKTSTLFFVVLSAAPSSKPGRYPITTKLFGETTEQTLEILDALNAPAAPGYAWGVDAIYASLLSEKEQTKLLESFENAGVTVWASRVRESDPALSLRNREHWQRVRQRSRLKLANWGEFWWPGTPYTDESKRYVEKFPETLGVWRADDRGLSIAGKLVCPTTLLSDNDHYLSEHLEKYAKLLKENGITEVMEDVEYSSPLSYCFDDRCKRAFAQYAKLDPEKIATLTPEELLARYQDQWVDFRCHQNSLILDKMSRMVRKLYPEVRFKLFCGYQSDWVKRRYGVDWPQLFKLPEVNGAYVGGGMPGTPEQISAIKELSSGNRKEFISMANATMSFPSGFDEIGGRSPAYLEARIVHDMMCGSAGIFIWWWGTLDGRCLKAFETGASLAKNYRDILLDGKHIYRKAGENADFYLLTAENHRGKLVALANPSQFAEDMVNDPESVMSEFRGPGPYLNLRTGMLDSRNTIRQRLNERFTSGGYELWFIEASK